MTSSAGSRDVDPKGLVPTEVLRSCPNCGSERIRFWLHGRDRLLGISDQIFDYGRCASCGVAFQSRRPVEAEIGRFYPEDYAPYDGEVAARATNNVRSALNHAAMSIAAQIVGAQAFQAELGKFYAGLKKLLNVLDFGCGSGAFLDRARKLGCETIGMDFSPVARSRFERRGHRALSIRDADWDKIADGCIELTRMNHVLEHLYDPSNVLRRLFAKMAPRGTLHVATPNSACKTAEVYGEHWFSLDCPRHIILFTPQSLRAIAELTGFTDIRVLHEPLTKDMARSFIYRQIAQGQRPPENVASRAEDGLLNIRFAMACRSAVREERSDRIHLFARKPTSGGTSQRDISPMMTTAGTNRPMR